MPTFKTVALSLAALLVSTLSVQAAPHHHKKPAHHAAAHAKRHAHGPATHSPTAMRSAPVNADRSADSLNAQSLSRAQSPVQ